MKRRRILSGVLLAVTAGCAEFDVTQEPGGGTSGGEQPESGESNDAATEHGRTEGDGSREEHSDEETHSNETDPTDPDDTEESDGESTDVAGASRLPDPEQFDDGYVVVESAYSDPGTVEVTRTYYYAGAATDRPDTVTATIIPLETASQAESRYEQILRDTQSSLDATERELVLTDDLVALEFQARPNDDYFTVVVAKDGTDVGVVTADDGDAYDPTIAATVVATMLSESESE